MLTRKTVVLAKVETTYGTDATPDAAADALLVSGVDIRPQGDIVTRDFLRDTLTPLPFVRGVKWVQVDFQTELKGTGTAGQLPTNGWEGTLFRGCGMKETVNAGVSVVYEPVSALTDIESLTLYVFKDGIFHKVLGCRGTFTLSGQVGRYITARWSFQGLYVSPVDQSPDPASFSSVKPPMLLLNGTFTVGSYAPVLTSFELGMNNRLALSRNLNSPSGMQEIYITGREPGGSFDPEAVLEATHPFWSTWESAGTATLNVGPVGSVAGNKLQIAASGLQYRDIGYGDRDGVLTYGVGFSLSGDGDDELTITFS